MSPEKLLQAEPSGQVRLVGFEIDPFLVMAAEFGERFTEYREAWARATAQTEIPEFPLSLDLEQNATCNLRCLMCPMGSKDYVNPMADTPVMDRGLYDQLIDEGAAHGLPAMTFGYLSEPLLRPDIADLTAYAREQGVMDIRLGTNGTLLSRQVARDLIQAGLTRLEISLDAATEATFNKLRRGGSYGRVVRNIDAFLEERARAGSTWPLLRLSFLRTGLNHLELDEFITLWRGKADFFSIQEMILYEDADIASDQTVNAGRRPEQFTCAQPWQRLIVRSNGDVYPCCSAYGTRLVLGNAQKESLHDLWHGPAMSDLRGRLAEGRYAEIPACRECAEQSVLRG
ncbi:MAG: radical SAM protein [Proteobacteria bacterium]|nr:radical SAM protein [Pseudomonadota bacterium]